MTVAEDRLWCLPQGGRELERYVEEFLELSNQVNWFDTALCVCFQLGLDDDVIGCDLPTYSFPLIELVNHGLYLNGVSLKVEEVQSDHHPVPLKNHRASSAHPSPGPSTYPAKCSNYPSPPSTVSVLTPETPAILQSNPPVSPTSSPPAVIFTLNQKRNLRRKRLLSALIPAPELAPVSAPVSLLSPERAPVPEFRPWRVPVPEFSPRMAPVPEFSPRGSPVPEFSPRGSPVPEFSPRGSPVLQFIPRGAPVPEFSPRRAPGPEFSPWGAPVPEFSPRRAPVPEFSPRRAPVPESSPERAPVPRSSRAPAPIFPKYFFGGGLYVSGQRGRAISQGPGGCPAIAPETACPAVAF